MMKKLFVVSDVHGYYTELIRTLENAGYDRENEGHLLVCCGDLFDRGTENMSVLKFFDGLENKIIVRGNHEDMLLDIFDRGYFKDNNFLNGTAETMIEFFGKYCFDGYNIDFGGGTRMLDRVTDLISGMKNYYETKNYVFVHGWLPIAECYDGMHIKENWRNASETEWKAARWRKWQDFYGKHEMIEGKTVVCGHSPCQYAERFDPSRGPDDYSMFFGDGMIAIDAGVYRSGHINLLILEDEVDI